MSDDPVMKKVLQGLGDLGVETAKETANQMVDMANSVITGKELVADAKPMSEAEMARAKAEDEKKKKEEMEKELNNIPGRDVGREMRQVSQEKENEEERKEREFLENIERQRREEEAERANFVDTPGNTKREAAKTQFAPGKKKQQAPTVQQMSQTSEFKGGKID